MKVDIVGCGAVAREYHAPILNAIRAEVPVEVAGCYDPSLEQAQGVAAAVGARRTGRYADPATGDGVDAAIIATPPHRHSELANQYVNAGKSVFVEKPFTADGQEARSLADAARRQRVRILVNQFWRFYPSLETARQWLSARLDEVESVEASLGMRWEWSAASTYVVDDPYGGVIHDTGAHVLDAVLYVLGLDGEPAETDVEIHELAKSPQREPSHECHAVLGLHRADGSEVSLEIRLSRLRELAVGVKVRGSFGTLFVPGSFSRAPILFDEGQAFRLRGANPATEPTDWRGSFLLALGDFATAVRDPDHDTRLDCERFLAQMEILDALREQNGT